MSRSIARSFAVALVLLAVSPTPTLVADGTKVAFPDYARGVLYWTQDRPQNKQVREFYVSTPQALDAARRGQALPDGTVLTVVIYNARLDSQGNPVVENGRFVKTDIRGFNVMEKRAGWGAEYAADKRNGEWEYQAFGPARSPNPMADLNTCFTCHKMTPASADFVYSVDQLKAAPPR